MNTLLKLKGCLFAYLLLVVPAVPALAGWEEGSKLPDLTGYQLDGALPELSGKVTYVDFWASWCVPCKASFPEMERLYRENRDAGFQVLAISVDATEKAMQRFLDRQKPSFAIVRDVKQKVVADAGIEVLPTSFLVDAEGVIRKVHVGWGGAKTAEELEVEIKRLLEELER